MTASRPVNWLRVLAWTVAWPVLLAALAIGGAWWWAGSDTSLETALTRAARYLPAGQSLQASGVTGSLRRGGRIAQLRWLSADMAVIARDVDVGWDMAVFLRRQLHLSHLQLAELRIVRTADAGSSAPLTPPQQLTLPVTIDIDVPFRIDTLAWDGPPAFSATRLAGRYRYDGTQHALTLDQVRVADGDYRAQASLGAHAPLALQLTLSGDLQAQVPGSAERLALRATASAQGVLGEGDAQLAVQARLEPAAAGATHPARVQASGVARIHPWAAQPLTQAQAQWSGLNLASLWPALPQTLLSGNLHVQPEGTGWQAQARVRNAASGPWDRQRIPAEQAEARLHYTGGAWRIDALTAHAGRGELRASGHWRAAHWQVDAALQNVDPALLHTRFASALLGGRARAEGAGQNVRFDVDLAPAAQQAARSPLRGLRLREIRAEGRWAAPQLTLSSLKLRTDDAQLAGQLAWNTRTRAASGALQVQLPGAQGRVRGQLTAAEGAGEFALDLTQAGQATRWLAQWPGMSPALGSAIVEGQAQLQGRWQGGWNAWAPTGPQTGTPSLSATLNVPRLDYRAAAATPAQAWQLRGVRAELGGAWSALQLRLQGEAVQGLRRVQLETQATGGRTGDGLWQARIATLLLRLQDGARPGPWNARLAEALDLRWQAAPAGGTLQAAGGTLLLSGPVPGTARIAWEPLRWQQQGTAARWRSAGRIHDLPLAWFDALLGAELANLQLAGTLVFDGHWDLEAGDTLRLSASLERKSGELSLVSEDVPGGRIEAGVRAARLSLQAEGEQVSLALRWDSERAGQLEADARTRFVRRGDAWEWPADAPLAGKLRAQLPRVGVWSMLAPPGWRVRGTLGADAQLTGTRAAPQWSGRIEADDLALRSVVEGIELRDGRLRAVLQGRRLELTAFSLRGAPLAGGNATSGGEVTATGFAQWLPGEGLRSDVQAEARSLRASLRADRRLVVSGTLRARTDGPKLDVQGALRADQATFILPDETAPSLGSDVVIVRPQAAAGASAAAQAAAAQPLAVPQETSAQRQSTIAVSFDMGEDFRVQGRGLSTRLAGTLSLNSVNARPGTPPRVTGELRTVSGSYRAYGQALDIERGVLRFGGAYDNPALDVLAIRPHISQRVGVQITGSALSPRIRLYAEPELPDAEKLAWLVLGRSAASGGAESAVLQQAALALLGGNGRGLSGGLAEALGLDELSVRGASTSTDGSTTTAATVTLGKRLTRNFYVAYERSLAGTLGSFYIFYDLSRRLTLRAQAGEKSAVDLIFTIPYD